MITNVYFTLKLQFKKLCPFIRYLENTVTFLDCQTFRRKAKALYHRLWIAADQNKEPQHLFG